MAIIEHENIHKLREIVAGKTVVFCSGSFDLLHMGHVLFLEDCKKQGDVLVVEIGNDEMIRGNKGINRPIFGQNMRLALVNSLKPVDYCYIGYHEDKKKKFSSLERTFKYLVPDKYVINEDAYDIPARKELLKKYKTELIVLKRDVPDNLERTSTTEVLEKILGKYKL